MTMRWGVIGAGNIARTRMIPGLRDAGHEVRVVTRRDQRAAAAVAAEFDVAATTTPDEVFADPDIDAVYIATPPGSHERLAIAALRAGKHVLLEKPMSLDLASSHRIAAVASDSGRALMLAYMMRGHPLHERMRQVLASGAIGEVRLVRADFCFEYADPSNWRAHTSDSGGGAFADLGPHLIDLIGWITGGPLRVAGGLWSGVDRAGGNESAATALLQLGADAHVTITTRFDQPSESAPGTLEFWGTEGSLIAQGTIGQLSAGRLIGPDGIVDSDGAVNLYATQAHAFARLVSAPEMWDVHVSEALEVQRLADDAYSAMAVSSSPSVVPS